MSEKLIYESKKSKLYKTESDEWGGPVLLKVLNYQFPTPVDISQFFNEFEITKKLDVEGVRRPLKKSKYNGRHCMYLNWIEGQNLRDAFKGKQNDIQDFLHLAITIANSVANIHNNGVIHRDLNPSNIMVDLQKREVGIISFSIASKIDLKEQHLGNPDQLSGTLGYISPEQTGRMNRVVDYRTDLYSLGITFYEMLCGKTPFTVTDALAMVHSHMAVAPTPVMDKNRNVPKAISDIIQILLAKKAEDRYQSAYGLKYDLEKCLELFKLNQSIEKFDLRSKDFSGKFNLPQQLYGRENELKTILDQFDSVSKGALEMILISGYSGTGKSVLVHEVHKPITEKQGYFIEGKFDQFQRAIPYYAIIQAFNSFVHILLTEDSEKLEYLKDTIEKAVGAEGQVLTDILPSLELIIGPQGEVPELGGAEAQHRFNYVFRKFVNALSTEAHPIVLFIDDLQWADSSSLSLLNTLLTDPENGYLLCIGAYRDNEVNASHPFIITVEGMKKNGATISEVTIGNLPLANINHLISDALNKTKEESNDLSALVHKKTQGNAFFTTQFLRSLYEESLLTFDHDLNLWKYSLDIINEQNITDNVVELIAGKAKKLPHDSLQALKFSACVGSSFDVEMLSIIHKKDSERTLADLQAPLSEGLVLPIETNFKFAHDRIQQAVYSLIGEDERDALHLEIGRLLFNKSNDAKVEKYLFDIANHLNSGVSLITERNEQKSLCELNLRAGLKAKETSAFNVAFDYFINGIDLLEEDPWKNNYQTTLSLYALAGETAYLNGDFDKMNKNISQVLMNATSLLDQVKSYEIKILAFKAENKLIEAINTGLAFLDQVGEKFPKNPKMVHVMVDLVRTKIKLRGKNNDTLQNLPVMTDENKIAAMRIMADIASSSYWATPTLFPLIVFRLVQLSLKYGNTAVSAFAFSTYGVIMCGVLGAMKSGHEFGKLGLILLDKFDAKEWKAQIYTPIYGLIVNWNEHIDKTLKPLQESYHIGMETGAIEFACINTNLYCIHSYLSGKRLEKIEKETKSYSQSFNQFNQETNFNYNEVYRQPMLNLMGLSKDPLIMIGEAFDEKKMMAQNEERNDKTGQFFIHFNKLILCYIFGDYKNGVIHSQESRKLLEAVLAKFEIPNHHFYEALTMLALYPDSNSSDKRKYIRRVNKTMRQMRKWAKDAPENFQHKYDLIRAQKMIVLGNTNNARLLFDKAIEGANKGDFIHEEALAHLLAGQYYLKQNSTQLAKHYLGAAYNAFREWGAKAKLKQLEKEYPQYVTGVKHGRGLSSNMSLQRGTTTVSSASSILDINTVIKSSSIISSEIVLEKLLKTLLKIVMENAGADRGLILLKNNSSFNIEAESKGQEKVEVLQKENYSGSGKLAEGIASFVIRSKESVVVQDAKNDPHYLNDEYLHSSEAQSVLCLPILNRGALVGVLYLENNLVTEAFTESRVELLSILSGQIAVSINNAVLYDNLEQKIAERTHDLALEKKKSDELLLNILPAETAEELKLKGTTTPRKFEKVTVLFTDFIGFTQMSEKLTPEELVEELDTVFSAFDDIIGNHNLEKIKTIGDSYMCAGGLPVQNSTHAIDAVNAGFEMLDFLEKHKEKSLKNNRPVFEVRIGIHSGPVVAGVVGSKKFAYDIWGDTVNTASRMESSGEEWRVNVSGSTYELIREQYSCLHRGKIEAKNKGEIDMYFVEKK